MSKLALAMIVKDDSEAELLKNCLDSVKKYVDGIFITTTAKPYHEIKKITEGYGGKHSRFKWIDDFSTARNYNWSQVPKDYDYLLWLDADDILVHPESISLVIKDMEERGIIWASFAYEYSKNILGMYDNEHWKIRLVKNDGKNIWKMPIHENLEHDGFYIWEKYTDVVVQHDFQDEIALKKQVRDYNILIKDFEEHGDDTDPRTIMYLGKASFGIGANPDFEHREEMLKQSLYFNSRHIELTGSEENKYFSTVELGMAYNYLGDIEKARRSFANATIIRPSWPDAYWYMCMLETDEQKFAEAVAWGESAMQKSSPETVLAVNSALYTVYGPFMLCQSYLALNMNRKALEVTKKLPANPKFDKVKALAEKQVEMDDYALVALKMIFYTKKYDQLSYQKLLNNVPNAVMANYSVQEMVMSDLKPKIWDEQSIAIFCGSGIEEWAPPSTIKGIGGSEEATINIAKELTDQGYNVTVYNNCGSMEGNYRGVNYLNFYKFNPNDQFDTLIVWRNPAMFTMKFKANKRYLWLHDKPESHQFNDTILTNLDRIIVLSDYHRSCLPDIPDAKFLVSTNGINLTDIQKTKVEREKGRIIWGSSYDRGVDHFLDIIKEVRKTVDVHPVVMYGWDGFDKVYKGNNEKMLWKEMIEKRFKDEGIEHLGRVSHKRVLEEYGKADVWLYPTAFWEINCISALKAQAMGAIPVTTTYAALDQSVQHGYKVKGVTKFMEMPDEVKQKLIKATTLALENPFDRDEMITWARKTYSWQIVAKQWIDDIKNVSH